MHETKDGIKPDSDKVQGLKDMLARTGPTEVKRFIAPGQCLSEFIHHLSLPIEKLKKVGKKPKENQNFNFGEKRKAFHSLKRTISDDTLLQ